MNDTNMVVSIQCITYNQEKYIQRCLDGFVMQITTFPFEVIVHDDASTDGTAEIVREYAQKYPHIIKPIIEVENQYSKHDGSIGRIMNAACKGRYIASCEGDDYWTDPCKLQKQVDFLNNNVDYMLCGSNGLVLWDGGDKNPQYFNRVFQSKELTPSEIIGHWMMPTASLMYRREILDNYPAWSKKIYSGDQTLILVALSKGRIYCLSDITCVYRKVTGGNSASNVADRNRVYVLKQHLILYEEYDKWTKGMFHKEIERALIEKKDELQYNTLSNRCFLLPFIVIPRYTIRKLYHKTIRFKNLLSKR